MSLTGYIAAAMLELDGNTEARTHQPGGGGGGGWGERPEVTLVWFPLRSQWSTRAWTA